MTVRSIRTSYDGFVTSDGVKLSYTLWSHGPLSTYRNLVLVLHGIGFHSEPYSIIPESLNLPDTLYAGLDYRGHGRSDGARGALVSSQRMLLDIEEWVSHLEAMNPGSRISLISDSMSGPYSVLYASQNPTKLSGLVLVAPAVLLSWRQILHIDSLKMVIGLARSPASPAVDLDGWRLAAGSDRSGFVGSRRGDPLAINAVSPSYIMRITQAIAKVFLRKSLSTNAPTLIIHGGKDRILSPLGSRLLKLRLKAPEKRLVILPDAHHTLMWDATSTAAAMTLIEDWLSRHSAAALDHA